ncbi:hypothetical protein CHUAL_009085 [Chamberlinius hualienensis]
MQMPPIGLQKLKEKTCFNGNIVDSMLLSMRRVEITAIMSQSEYMRRKVLKVAYSFGSDRWKSEGHYNIVCVCRFVSRDAASVDGGVELLYILYSTPNHVCGREVEGQLDIEEEVWFGKLALGTFKHWYVTAFFKIVMPLFK